MNNRTSLKKGDCETFSFFVPHSLDSKIREYLVENSYESLAEFIRQAIDEQLILESPLKLPLPKNRKKMLLFCVAPNMRERIENCTAKTNYSSISDFIRSAMRNKLSKGEIKT